MAPTNILPYDGELYYHPDFYLPGEAESLYEKLLREIPWQHDEVVIFGKHITTKRMMAWFGEAGFDYIYSGSTKTPNPYTDFLLLIQQKIELQIDQQFNSCLLNLYHDGTESMGWHSDNENSLQKNASIAALSFGAERRMVFKHKASGEKVELLLKAGSLVVMAGTIQQHWLHAIPKMMKVKEPRISLTFRKMKKI